MGTTIKPIVKKIEDNIQSLNEFQESLPEDTKERNILLEFPAVYIHHWKNRNKYMVYVGESKDVFKRTKQHYGYGKNEDKWQHQLLSRKADLYIISHEHFNKSMTLDIENQLRNRMMGVSCVREVCNRRGNPQNRYYPDGETDRIFEEIWNELHKSNKELFPVKSEVEDSAIYKVSPFHKLKKGQGDIKEDVLERIFDALQNQKAGQLIFVEGEAGTGKTVLNSSIFKEIFAIAEEEGMEPLKCCLLVNHREQLTVYRQMAQKLGLIKKYGNVVCKPTTFIHNHTQQEPIDVAFVDEAHLLLTQGRQSYQGHNQLKDIMERARITVIMFDENQILTTEQYWEAEILNWYRELAKQQKNYFKLENQLRMKAPQEVLNWIDDFTKKKEISKVPDSTGGYEIRIFENPFELEDALKKKAAEKEHKLSRLIATYDWAYNEKSSSDDRVMKYWEVVIGEWHKPWNRELDKELDRETKRVNKELSWAEQPQTLEEVGSTYTIQGFDLDYAGVILGDSVTYCDGQIVFEPEVSHNKKAICNRTLSDGTKQKFGETLIQHEVRVLMTRGIKGLYIYACNPELREALLNATER